VTLSPRFQALYSAIGRPSIPSEQLLRALLLQVRYTIRSERQLMEQLDYSLLYRWFVGLIPDDAVWVPTVFTKNRDRLLEGNIAEAFFQQVLALADQHHGRRSTMPSGMPPWRCSRSSRRRVAAGPSGPTRATIRPARCHRRRGSDEDLYPAKTDTCGINDATRQHCLANG
jgi:hypothetical protein